MEAYNRPLLPAREVSMTLLLPPSPPRPLWPTLAKVDIESAYSVHLHDRSLQAVQWEG